MPENVEKSLIQKCINKYNIEKGIDLVNKVSKMTVTSLTT